MKDTRRSLLTSTISLLLCFVMLLGTTFAWFTDIAVSEGNVIQAGKLDIELMQATKTASGWDWQSASGKAIFDYDKWEPGYTTTAVLGVQNNGTLSANWTAKLVLNGTPTILADVIEIYVTSYKNYPDARPDFNDGNWQKLGTVRDILDNDGLILPGGQIDPGRRQPILVALHMREDAGNEYQGLNLGANFDIVIMATQASAESDSFGSDYDTDAKWPEIPSVGNSASANVTLDENNLLTEEVTMTSADGKISATLPAGTKLLPGTTTVKLVIADKENSEANLTLDDNQASLSLDVHVTGIADDNDKAIKVELGEVLPTGLNMGNYNLYHVEDGQTNIMTLLDDTVGIGHNTYAYDPSNGKVVVYMASFSEVTLVAEPAKWEGNFDYSWYTNAVAPVDGESTADYVIANADQLAAFGAIVGGMNGQTQDSFSGKTVKLISDINLGDKESENNPDIIFYPIGYYNSEGTYERTNTAITSGLKNFEGTFDGNGHTVSNFYQNTWEMKGDHNWYSPEEQYYRDGMGLFGRVYGGTVKNLTVKNFSSDGEIATTGVIAAYADGATFENIAIFNCNPRVYNIGNGGIVGCVGWYAKEANLKTTFTNITVDNSNKISALWGSYDVACGGIVGQYYPTSGQTSAGTPKNAGIEFTNCHVSAVMDVYNDVCANYQYYAYRYTGMLIGSVRENVEQNGHVYPDMTGITAENCTVHFGDWNDYYYCEIVANSLASYTHDHQFSRLTQVASVDVENMKVTDLKGNETDIPTSGWVHYVVVKNKDNTTGKWIHGDGSNYATCYHFKDGEVWTHDKAGTETVNGVEGVLKEDKQLVYLEFNNLVTGYGWGVTSKGVGDLTGVTILDRAEGNSVEKFESDVTELSNNREYKLSEIFTLIENTGVELVPGALAVSVTNLEENNLVSATIVYDRNNWENSTITLTGDGKVKITIQDYYFCTPTTIEVTVTDRQPEEKFELVFQNTEKYLYKIGNVNTVKLGQLFKAKDGAEIGTVSVKVAAVEGSGASGVYTSNATWTNGTIQFSGTGVVKVTITDNDYCTPTVLYLEVVDAVNATTATSATANNVVLLNDISSGFTVSGRYAVYGNGFTLNYTGNGQYLNNGLKQGIVTVSGNGTLDNLRIKASIYPTSYLYYEQVKKGPSSVEGDKTRYHYQLSAVAASENATISNCYIYGGRNNIYIGTGNVTVKDTVLECGTVSNIQIISNDSHTITFENLTTIQYLVSPTVFDDEETQKDFKMIGFGIFVGDGDADIIPTNPKLVFNGDLKQYNWVSETEVNGVNSNNSGYIENALNAAIGNETYKRDDGTANMGVVFLNNQTTNIENNTGIDYQLGEISIMNVTGQVYSIPKTETEIYTDYANADRSTVNGLYVPQFKYPADLGGQYIEKTDDGDEFVYREGDVIYVMFPSGDSKELDLAALVNIVKYTGQDLGLVITVKDGNGNAVAVNNGKITLSAAEEYTITYTVTDTLFYDKGGNTVDGTEMYSWDVTVSVSLKDTAVPNAYFTYDTTKQTMGYAKKSVFSGGQTQYLPFLAGLKIYDYVGQNAYLRFDGDSDFSKIASAEITGYTSANHVLIKVTLTDGGVINIDTTARAASGGSTYTGKLQTSGNTLYYVNDGTTSATTTTWVISSYKFVGNNGVEIDSGAVTFSNCENGSVPTGSFSTTIKYTVTYDANGGDCGQTVGYATSAATAVTLPTPTRSGYTFTGWYTAASGGERVGGADDSYTPSANITLYAQWGTPSTVTYDANGGSCGTASEKFDGKTLILPEATRDGYTFLGWYTAATGGERIGPAGMSYNPTGDITLYAQWQLPITVTYEVNGGSCGTENEVYDGDLTLPTPTRTGYDFLGWYTAETNGTRVGGAGESYTPSADITLYAQWEQISYTITTDENKATVTVDKTSAHYGDTVTVTVSFSENNDKSLTVTDASGNEVLSKSAAGTYTFTMPASNVTIKASSSGTCFTPDTLITLADGTQVRVDSLTGEEMLLVWNHQTGAFESVPVAYIVNHGGEKSEQEITHLYFSDGNEIKIIGEHVFFDVTQNKYVSITSENAEEYIGHLFTGINGTNDALTTIELTKVERYVEETEVYEVVSYEHLTCFTNNILSTSAYLDKLLNIFDINPDTMAYSAELVQKDIETYGLYTYADFEGLISEEAFEMYNASYLKIAVGKGYITWDDILDLIDIYFAAEVNPIQ